jgi:hypothetical protein
VIGSHGNFTLSTCPYARLNTFVFPGLSFRILLPHQHRDKSNNQKEMKTKPVLTLLLFAVLASSGMAQDNAKKSGFELSSGVAFPLSEPGGANLKTGFGFEGIFHYQFMPHLGLYAGWGWNRNQAPESFAGKDADFEETGYVFGLQFKHAIGSSPVSWYARAAGLYNHIEVENTAGEIIYDSGHGLGWQVAGGIDIDLGRNWSLTPGLKFNSLNREIEVEGNVTGLSLNYLSARAGILKRF